MGLYLTEPTSVTAAEDRPADPSTRGPPSFRRPRLGAQNLIRGPTSSRILSSKYRDRESYLYYYGFRYYAARTGRWGRRAPIAAEQDNLLRFVSNSPIDAFDPLGLATRRRATPSPTPPADMTPPATYTTWFSENPWITCNCCCASAIGFGPGTLNKGILWGSRRDKAFFWQVRQDYSFPVTLAYPCGKTLRVTKDCVYNWQERSTEPINLMPSRLAAPSRPVVPGTYMWTDITAYVSRHPQMAAQWVDPSIRRKRCGGTDTPCFIDKDVGTTRATDDPITRASWKWKLEIALTVKSSPDCPCKNESVQILLHTSVGWDEFPAITGADRPAEAAAFDKAVVHELRYTITSVPRAP
jgi:RHS repeat-associated protein